MRKLIYGIAALSLLTPFTVAQVVTSGLVGRYAMTDASGTTLPDTSGSGNNGTLVNSPTIGTKGITFSRSSSQSATLPAGLSTTVQTVQIFADFDRYNQAGSLSAIIGNSAPSGMRLYFGATTDGMSKGMVVDMGTTLATGISATDTTITLTSSKRMPAGNYFTIDSEVILCSALSGNTYSGCTRNEFSSGATTHSAGAPVWGNAFVPNNGSNLIHSSATFGSYFSLQSPSMYTFVIDGANSRMLDNKTETLYGGFNSSSSVGYDISTNTGQWSLGGDSGEYYNGTIYYVLMYNRELTTTEIQQNVDAVNTILTARGMDPTQRNDGLHTQNILLIEGTSIDNFWGGAGMTLTSTFEQHVTAQPGISYNGGIDSYTVARDQPLTNPTATRDVVTLGAPTNDFANHDLPTTETAYQTAITTMKSEGWREVYCGTMLSRTGTGFNGVTFDSYHDQWNTWIRANWQSIGCTGLSDPAADSRLGADGAYANTTYFTDGVHPASAGNVIYAAAWQNAINQANNIALTFVGSTETQITFKYKAPDANACTITVADNNGGPSVNDVNAALFANANSDLGRTEANGFRWPTAVNGLERTVTVGGHDEVKLAANGDWKSTALQVNSDHTFGISCDSGTYTGSAHFSTKNIPINSTYPEQFIPVANAPMGGFAQPTRQWTLKRNEKFIDPITGVLMIGISGPLDEYEGVNGIVSDSFQYTNFSYALDRTGAWTSKDNAFTVRAAGTLASTSTQNAPLFLAPNATDWSWYGQQDLTDVQVFPYGTASAGVNVGHCLSTDSGQTCFTKEIIQSFDTAAAHLQGSGVPATGFSGGLSAWKPFSPDAMMGNLDLSNPSYNGGGGNNVVNASGSVVTLTNRTGAGFLHRAPGSKFQLSGCATGPNVELTVAHVDTPTQITVQETGLSNTNCTYQDRAFGLRVELLSAGTVNLSETLVGYLTAPEDRRTNAAEYMCAPSKVTDIHIGVDGTTYTPNMSGYLCALHNDNSGLIVLIQDDGKIGLQSVLSSPGLHNNSSYTLPESPWVNANTLLISNRGNNDVVKVQKDASGDYTEYVPGTSIPDDKFTYTDITAANTAPLTQIQNSGDKCAQELAKNIIHLGGLQTIAGGYLYYYIGAGSGDGHGGWAFFDPSGNYIGCQLGYDKYPMRNGAMHQGPEAVGKYVISNFGNRFLNYDSTNVLGGPFVMQPGGYKKNGSWTSYTIPVSAATNASPVVLTSANNDLDAWQAANKDPYDLPWITCSGGTGSWTGINGTFRAKRVDNNTFSLLNAGSGASVDSTAWGVLSGSVFCSVTRPLFDLPIASVGTNSADGNAAQVTLSWQPGFGADFPSGLTHVQDGDPVAIAPNYTAQYYVKRSCTGCSDTVVDVYSDPGLTTPVSAASLNGATTMANAESCPAFSSLSGFPGQIYFDLQNGPGETPTKVRCVTYEYATEPCSYWAASAESTAYPCTGNVQAYTSMIQTIQPGDALFDVSHGDVQHEKFMVLSKDTTSHPGFIRLTLMRFYGDGWMPYSTWDGQNGKINFYAYNHSPGWTPQTFATTALSLIDASSPSTGWIPMPPQYVFSHLDIAESATPGNVVTVPSWQSGNQDGLFDVPLTSVPTIPLAYTHNGGATWNGTSSYSFTTFGQSYPSARQLIYNPQGETKWAGDSPAMNVLSGNGINAVDGFGAGTTGLTPVAGAQHVYIVPVAGGTPVNIKVQPYIAISPGYLYARDISSAATGDIITDATNNTICYAKNAGECRHDSTAGTWYLSMAGAWDGFGGQYAGNQFTFPTPMLFGPAPWAGWAVQMGQKPIDTLGAAVRRLTLGFTLPGTHMCFQNWRQGPPIPGGGTWAFFNANPWQKRLRLNEPTGTSWLLGKVPAWPSPDTAVRDKFRNVPITFSGKTGDQIRIAFGYGENGGSSAMYCTQRAERCWTTNAPTAADPFVYAGEAQSKTPCSSGCTVNIPAIPGRTLFYQVERTNTGTGAVTTGPVQRVAVD